MHNDANVEYEAEIKSIEKTPKARALKEHQKLG